MIEYILTLFASLGTILLAFFMEARTAHAPQTPRETPVKPPQSDVEPEKVPDTIPESESKRQAIYDAAYSCIGKDISLNQNVPNEVQCCQAVSYVLKKAGIKVPKGGIYGVKELEAYLRSSGFKEVQLYTVGAIITARRPIEGYSDLAHAGVCGKNWIMSNDSANGHWAANYTANGWKRAFDNRGAVRRYFVP